MIIPLPFIVSLLFTITYATDFEYKIDWATCDITSNCYIQKWCHTNLDNDKAVLHLLEQTDAVPNKDNCEAIIQIRSISERHYLVIMEVKSAASDLDPTAGISIKQFGGIQLECKDSNAPIGNEGLQLEYYGLNSHVFTEERMFCSIYVTTKDDEKTIAEFFKNDVAPLFPSLEYSSKTAGTVIPPLTYYAKKDAFWKPSTVRCEASNIVSADSIDDSYELKRIDMFQDLINCPDNGKLRFLYDGPEVNGVAPAPVETFDTKLECAKVPDSPNNKYKWSPVLEKAGTYNIACVKTSFCSACGDTPPSSPEDCPQDICTATPTIGKDTTGCQTLTCPSTENEFTFDGKSSAKSEGSIICKKSASDPTTGGWFFKGDEDAVPVEHAKIACAAIRDCDHSQFDFKCPSDTMTCEENTPDYDGAKFNFTCKNGYLQKADGKGEALATVCDRKTGKWQNLEDNANIVCAQGKKDESSEKKEGESTSSAGAGMYVGIVGGILVIAAIGAILYYMLVFKKKQEAKKTTKKEEGTSKKSSKKVESKSGAAGSSNEAKKEEKKSDPNKESEKPAAEAAKEAPKDGKEAPKEGAEAAKEPPKDPAATPAAAATPGAPPTPAAAAPATPAADSAPAPADATPV